MTKQKVVDFLIDTISGLLGAALIAFIVWQTVGFALRHLLG